MHNVFYPMDWQETTIDIRKIWAMYECKTTDEIQKSNELFESEDYF